MKCLAAKYNPHQYITNKQKNKVKIKCIVVHMGAMTSLIWKLEINK